MKYKSVLQKMKCIIVIIRLHMRLDYVFRLWNAVTVKQNVIIFSPQFFFYNLVYICVTGIHLPKPNRSEVYWIWLFLTDVLLLIWSFIKNMYNYFGSEKIILSFFFFFFFVLLILFPCNWRWNSVRSWFLWIIYNK